MNVGFALGPVYLAARRTRCSRLARRLLYSAITALAYSEFSPKVPTYSQALVSSESFMVSMVSIIIWEYVGTFRPSY